MSAGTSVTERADAPGSAPDRPPVRFRGRELRARKGFLRGTHRVVAPEVTLEWIRPLFPEVGLTRLANVTGLDRIGLPTVLAVRPNAGYLSVDAGKGLSLEAASVSAAMECIERFRAERVRLEEVHASYRSLARTSAVVATDRLPLSRHSLFRPDRPERWTHVWDLIAQRSVAVPVGLVNLERYRLPRTDGMTFQTGTNGLASGNVLLEAILSGLLEVVERDGVTTHGVVWDRLGVPPPRVDLAGADGLLGAVLERVEGAGARVVLFDCTVDTELPTYMAYLYEAENRNVGLYRGYGAHLDPTVAALRAVTEATQSRLVFIAGSRDDWFLHNHVRHKGGDTSNAVNALERIPETRSLDAHHDASSASIEADVHLVVAAVQAVGLDHVLVADLSRDDDPVAVARVIVPGLEGYATAAYQPGPRALAFLERRQRELA